MAWEQRHAQSYYYRTIRLPGGGFQRQYWGRGVQAQEQADLDIALRQEKEARRQEARLLLEQDLEQDADFARVEALAKAALVAAGFHRRSGEWRRRRT